MSVKQTQELMREKASKKCIIQWYSFLMEICSRWLMAQPLVQLGGLGQIVELDESFLGHRRKYNRGAFRGQQYIIFGILDRNTKKNYLLKLHRTEQQIR
jgi:hypothetical protein